MSNWQLNDSAPVTLGQDSAAVPNPWVEKYWGAPGLALQTVAGGTVHSGQAAVVASAAALMTPSIVRGLIAAVNAITTVVVVNEVRRAGIANVVSTAVVSGGSSVIRRLTAPIVSSTVASVTPKRVTAGIAPVQLSTIVTAGFQLVGNGVDIVLAALVTNMKPSAIYSMAASMYLGAPGFTAMASLISAHPEVQSVEARGKALKLDSGNKVFKTRWLDRVPTKKKKWRDE